MLQLSMKKNKKLLIILVVLIIPAVYFIFKNTNTTVKKELREFAVKDTAAISKIFLADRNGNKITLEKKNNTWILNEKFHPRPDFMQLFIEVIYKVDVRNRVAKAAYNNVIKSLASSGIKCEIYLNGSDEPFKTYYVGGQTEDALGTFMIIENSNAPFVTQIPGFNGYLTPRYSVNIDAWKQPIIFQTLPGDIKSLSINYSNFPEKSFTINPVNGSYRIVSPSNKNIINRVDSVAVENYLSFYSNVFFESPATKLTTPKKDSLLLNPPSIVISLTRNNGITKELDIYPMFLTSSSLGRYDSAGNLLKYDLDRVYGYIKPDKEFVILQHFSLDRLLRQFDDFNLEKSKP